MKNRRYAVVIMDFTGRHARRITVSRFLVDALAGVAIFFVVALFAAAAHGLWISGDAAESMEIRHENQELARVLQQLESQMPKARDLSMHSEMTFSELWGKSGLGVEPRLTAPQAGEGDSALQNNGANVLAADAMSLPLEVERIESDGYNVETSVGETLEYFHDAERLLLNTPSIRPARTPWLTSSFGIRLHPIRHLYIMHKGLDMAGHTGMPIYAPADGVVIWVGKRGGYGNTVVVDHGYGLQTHFAHLSKFLVSLGEHIHRGDAIAEMGSTGKSTGPHLHYEVRRNGQPMDPRRFILD